jgi:uncharacterized membrane protein YdcZ (DUF606 family)
VLASALSPIIVDAVVPHVMAHLMLALLVIGRIIAAAACQRDGWYGERAPATANVVRAFV